MVLTETKQFGGCVFMTLNDLKIGQSGIITAVGGEGALRVKPFIPILRVAAPTAFAVAPRATVM